MGVRLAGCRPRQHAQTLAMLHILHVDSDAIAIAAATSGTASGQCRDGRSKAHQGWVFRMSATVFASLSRPRSSIACSWLGGRPAWRLSGSSTCMACRIAGSTCEPGSAMLSDVHLQHMSPRILHVLAHVPGRQPGHGAGFCSRPQSQIPPSAAGPAVTEGSMHRR